MRRTFLVTVGWGLSVVVATATGADDLGTPPAGLAGRAEAIVEAVLAHQIDPPTRQQMILDGLKAVYLAAGVPCPADLARRVSAVATPDQLAALIAEAWPRQAGQDVKGGTLEDAFCEGMLSALPGALLQSATERRATEQIEANLYVGVHIGIIRDETEKWPAIAKVFEGGPADRAGARDGDRIEAIDGVATEGVPIAESIERLRGAEGTDVVVRLRGKAEPEARTLTMTRGRMPRTTVSGTRKRPDGGWTFRLDGPDAIGYAKLDSIAGSTPQELRRVAPLIEAEGIRALILDLRGVSQPGLHPTVLLADTLLDGGTIGRVRTNRSVDVYEAEPDVLFRDLPLAVVVDRTTSGATVWLCAALQDNHRAVVVGTPPGSAEVQSSVTLPGGAWSVRLTTGRLERGDGRPLAGPPSLRLLKAASRFPFGPFLPTDILESFTPDIPVVDRARAGMSGSDTTPGDPADDRFVIKARERLAEGLKAAGP